MKKKVHLAPPAITRPSFPREDPHALLIGRKSQPVRRVSNPPVLHVLTLGEEGGVGGVILCVCGIMRLQK